MNSIVRAWYRACSRHKPDGPDGLTIDDEQVTLMASRKNTNPNIAMTKEQFNSVITMALECPLDRVLQVRTGTYNALKRLGAKRDTSKAVGKNPHGSTQNDVGSLLEWLERVLPEDTKAIAQIVTLDATCCSRGT